MIYNSNSGIEFFFITYISVLFLSVLLYQDNVYLRDFKQRFYNYIMELFISDLSLFYSVNEEEIIKEEDKSENEVVEEKFENKYLKQFKELENNYSLSNEEQLLETDKYDELVNNWLNTHKKEIFFIKDKLTNLREILDKGEVDGNDDIKKIVNYHNLEIENENSDDDEQETYNLNALFLQLLNKETEYINLLKEVETRIIDYDELKKESHNFIINKHLENLINNYIIEYTPLGNVIMRYNNLKGSFEYFSNSSIPYRYLEPIGRKYVITYKCKPLFIDLEEELKKAEENLEEEQKKKKQEDLSKPIFAKLKNYNKNISNNNNIKPLKNRVTNNIILPPQIKINVSNENKKEKQLLKENANRYTWEGRLSVFNPLKKVDRKLVDKKYGLTYADFKRMQLTK